jgi:hypothetical protein
LNTNVALTYLAGVPGLFKAVGYDGNIYESEIKIKDYRYTTNVSEITTSKGETYFAADRDAKWYDIDDYKRLHTKYHTFFETAVIPAKNMHNTYHNSLYPGLKDYRETVLLPQVKEHKNVHGGLGCYLNQTKKLNNGSVRTINNFHAQFWSILSLIGLEKFRRKVEENGLTNDIKSVASVYDSVYMLVRKDADIIRWAAETLKPILEQDYIHNQTLKLDSDIEISLDSWADFVDIDLDNLEEQLKG